MRFRFVESLNLFRKTFLLSACLMTVPHIPTPTYINIDVAENNKMNIMFALSCQLSKLQSAGFTIKTRFICIYLKFLEIYEKKFVNFSIQHTNIPYILSSCRIHTDFLSLVTQFYLPDAK